MKFTLRQLEIFAAVGRVESISKATEFLALSQSATSTALSELEKQFGSPLFDRVGKSLKLNELGRKLLPQAMVLLDKAHEIEEIVIGKMGFGTLNIGATLTIGNYLATLIVADFLQRHPESKVQLKVNNSTVIMEQLMNFELDLGLVEGDCAYPDLASEPWVADELVVFCPPGHRLAKIVGNVPLAELMNESWVVREKGSGTREVLNRALEKHNAHPPIRLELEHTEAIKRAVESGLGLGCISRLALREAFRRGSLVPLDVPELDLRRNFHFVWHHQKHQTAGMREFVAQCRAMTMDVTRSDSILLPYIP